MGEFKTLSQRPIQHLLLSLSQSDFLDLLPPHDRVRLQSASSIDQMNLTALWSYTLPSSTPYETHLTSIKKHIQLVFNNEALLIDEDMIQSMNNQTSQMAQSNFQNNASIPQSVPLHIQQQHGVIPAWLHFHHRATSIWHSTHSTASGTGGGILSPKTAIHPHHKQWLQQQSQQINESMPSTCTIPVESNQFFATYLSDDIDNIYLTIPYCPDAAMLSKIQMEVDTSTIFPLTENFKSRAELTTDLDHLPLDFVERYIRTVTASLGGDLVKYDKNVLSLFELPEFNSKLITSFSITKDLFIVLPGNRVLVSIGRVRVDNRLTNTIIVEIELLGFTSLNLDPLVFQKIFSTLHPLSSKFLWKYANTPFSPSKTYTIHDIVPNEEQREALKQFYNPVLLPSTASTKPTLNTYIYERPPQSFANPAQQASQQPQLSPEQLHQQQLVNIINNNPLDFRQYDYRSDTSQQPTSLDDFMIGTCSIPSISTSFQQYRLHEGVFHPEHLSLMYTQIFLHPHQLQ